MFIGCKSTIIYPDISKWNINKIINKDINSIFSNHNSDSQPLSYKLSSLFSNDINIKNNSNSDYISSNKSSNKDNQIQKSLDSQSSENKESNNNIIYSINMDINIFEKTDNTEYYEHVFD